MSKRHKHWTINKSYAQWVEQTAEEKGVNENQLVERAIKFYRDKGMKMDKVLRAMSGE